jgi:hypothetical protein
MRKKTTTLINNLRFRRKESLRIAGETRKSKWDCLRSILSLLKDTKMFRKSCRKWKRSHKTELETRKAKLKPKQNKMKIKKFRKSNN